MDPILKVNHLVGGYSRQNDVLHDISFEIKPGELVGLVGLNGAGKSTTIKHILGLLQPHSGEININGIGIKENMEQYRRQIAYVPETPELYEHLTLKEHLSLSAMAYGLDKKNFEHRVEDLAVRFRMEKRLNWFPGQFSKGMKQKVMIMCAFLVNPSLYVVDEPFVGLDPIGIQSFLDLMIEMKENGCGILMSTHILSTAEQYCDRFIILHDGKCVVQGNLEEIKEKYGKRDATLHDIYVAIAKGDTAWIH
ncbi:ABC transporter ATP-binding protein [Terrilactibacillus laevilacticus]|uniref:ABC transporter ATP-binding protein n=1 Tax=Terrilactibacillus laevilacticus TaxID=1380157 RepID=A0ABW5PQN7_9BACI|nr:ABC transporter ATP-binding protein [Terrilactibacillus laevilacticus]